MAGERIRLRQQRWARAKDGPWTEPATIELTNDDSYDWRGTEYEHPVFKGEWLQTRVISIVVPEPPQAARHDRPNAEGWWFWTDGQSVEWLRIGPNGALDKLDEFTLRHRRRWYGPIVIPEDK